MDFLSILGSHLGCEDLVSSTSAYWSPQQCDILWLLARRCSSCNCLVRFTGDNMGHFVRKCTFLPRV